MTGGNRATSDVVELTMLKAFELVQDAVASDDRSPLPAIDIRRGARHGGGHRFPGGASVTETWTGPQQVTVAVAGELDAFDRNALVDVFAATILAGAREIVLDAAAVSFADTAVLHAVEQVRRHLRRGGGSLISVGLETLPVSRSLTPEARSAVRHG